MWDNKLVSEVLFFATKNHSGQKMMYPENMPYSAHFTGVMLNAIKYALLDDENLDWDVLICCALLHDVVEDCEIKLEEIKERFGEKIANGVNALTKNEALKKEDKMSDSLLRIKKCGKEIAIVKMADRFFNIRDRVPTWTKEKQENYLIESKLILKELGKFSQPIAKALKEAIKNY